MLLKVLQNKLADWVLSRQGMGDVQVEALYPAKISGPADPLLKKAL